MEPILKTKLYLPPPRPDILSRPRLLQLFQASVRGKLMIITAPAGYGKATLLGEAINECGIPVGWVSLDENDNDPTRFWLYFFTALSNVNEKLGQSSIELLQFSQSPNIDTLLQISINEISEFGEEFIVVLDDFHVIEEQAIWKSFSFLIDTLPLNIHMVISGRIDPPIAMSKLRIAGQLKEIRAADLRFNDEETTAFFLKNKDLSLTINDVNALIASTEGWIAGLRMAALSLEGKQDVSAFIESFSGKNKYILDYLTEEVLNSLDTDTRNFLLETSILERLTGPLCDAVTEREDSHIKLRTLDKLNLFIEPLDEEREWYRYHHLFADLLRNYLVRSKQKSPMFLHLRASEWFEQQGSIAEAIEHALEAKYYPRAVQLIDSVAFSTIAQCCGFTLPGWLERIPKEITYTQPWLCFYNAVANHVTGNIEAGDEFIQRAEEAICQAEEVGSRHLPG